MSRPIEWYSVSPIKGVAVVAVIAFSVMITGVFIIAFGLDNSGRVPLHWQPWMLSLGICIVIGGVSIASYGFFRVLSHKTDSLVLQTDGILYTAKEQEYFYHWQAIESIEFERGLLTFSIEDRPSFQIKQSFLGISGADLAARIREIQRKVLLGTIQ